MGIRGLGWGRARGDEGGARGPKGSQQHKEGQNSLRHGRQRADERRPRRKKGRKANWGWKTSVKRMDGWEEWMATRGKCRRF
jgi:hypothetical protein